MRLRAALPGLTAVLCLGACGTAADLADAGPGSDRAEQSRPGESPSDPASPTTTPPATPKTTPTTRPAERPPKRLPHVVGAVDFFASPSRNIGCLITETAVRCDIQEKSYLDPPRPASCQLDYGSSLQVGRAGPADYACVGDTVLGAAQVLPYHSSTVVGDFGCTSRETGMTCYNLRTRHGFLISREIVNLFQRGEGQMTSRRRVVHKAIAAATTR
jgi:hypothetical protein